MVTKVIRIGKFFLLGFLQYMTSEYSENMKKILFLLIISLNACLVKSTDLFGTTNSNSAAIDFPVRSCFYMNHAKAGDSAIVHRHKEVFLSLGFGYDAGNISINNTDQHIITKVSGHGFGLDIKLGFALSKNLIMHAAYINFSLSDPESHANYASANTYYSKVKESILGGGFSYYSTRSRFFFSGIVGPGHYKFQKAGDNFLITTKNGLAMQLKAGFSVWITEQGSFAIALEHVRMNSSNINIEKIFGSRTGLSLSLSFN
jgi:hypothetical protein